MIRGSLLDNVFKKFSAKYGIESKVMDDEFATLKIKKDEFNEETLMDQIKKLVCREHVKDELLYHIETKYQEDEHSPSVPMTIDVYTEQWCSDERFLKDLRTFVGKIIYTYNKGLRKNKIPDDIMLGIEATYLVEIPKLNIDDGITYYVFLSVEDVYEQNDTIYVTLGLW
jgi:hypothetical protein